MAQVLTCPNCGRDVAFDGGAEAICAACPVGGADGDTHFDPSGAAPSGADTPATDATPAADAPAGNQPGADRDPAWVLPEHGVDFENPVAPGKSGAHGVDFDNPVEPGQAGAHGVQF
jgi:hypothetical protein